jgi:predicted Zn-dependent peptidase
LPEGEAAIRILIVFVILGWAQGLEAQETRETALPESNLPVREHTLENGLRLLVLPRSGAPTVSFVVQYAVGSVNEAPGTTGIAHFLEHLFFKGTTTVGTRDYRTEASLMEEMDILYDSILLSEGASPPDTSRNAALWSRLRDIEEQAAQLVASNEFDEILSRNGARNLNATTTMESTTYFVDLPANRAELWFVLEADRMKNPVFREFFRERDVVAEERRQRLDNNPGALLIQAHLAAAFTVHPYGNPVIGYMSDLQRITRSQVESYYQRYYGPNNAVVAVVGDVDPAQIIQWARAYLGPIPAGAQPPPVRAVEPEQRGERRVEVVYDAEPILRIGWKVPSIHHPDAPALSVLASLLTGGRSSRLYRRMILEDRVASGVTSTTEPGQRFPGLFVVESTPLSPHTLDVLERVIYEELTLLAEEGPEEAELQRVRNQLEAGEVRRLRSNFGLALQLVGSATLFGDWHRTFAWSRELRKVTPEDIRRVVKRYFQRESRTVATLVRPSAQEGGVR